MLRLDAVAVVGNFDKAAFAIAAGADHQQRRRGVRHGVQRR